MLVRVRRGIGISRGIDRARRRVLTRDVTTVRLPDLMRVATTDRRRVDRMPTALASRVDRGTVKLVRVRRGIENHRRTDKVRLRDLMPAVTTVRRVAPQPMSLASRVVLRTAWILPDRCAIATRLRRVLDRLAVPPSALMVLLPVDRQAMARDLTAAGKIGLRLPEHLRPGTTDRC